MNLIDVLTLAGTAMPFAMMAWLLVGVGVFGLLVVRISRDERALSAVTTVIEPARASDHDSRKAIQIALATWTQETPRTGVHRWIRTVHNTVVFGGATDASALSDSVWSLERDRLSPFRFFARQAVVLGLLFTSAGLCVTLQGVIPAITEKSSNATDWIGKVQTALAVALDGMASAFYSSLAGIAVALTLGLLGLLLNWLHDRYVYRLDAFIQGGLLPIFSALVEKDRNDVITETMDKAFGAFSEVRQQFERLLETQSSQSADLRGFRDLLGQGVKSLSDQMQAFGEQVGHLQVAADRMESAGGTIASAIDVGIGRMETAHTAMLEQISDYQEEVMKPLAEQVSSQFERQQEAMEEHTGKLSQATEEFAVLARRIGEQVSAVETAASESSAAVGRLEETMARSQQEMQHTVEQLATGQQAFIDASTAMHQDQTTAMQASANHHLRTLDRMDQLVAALSVSGEAIQGQLQEVYELHRQAVSGLYDRIGEDLAGTLQAVAKRGADDMVTHLTDGVRQAINDTHDRLTGLDQAFRALAEQQGTATAQISQLGDAIRLNADAISQELANRRGTLDQLLERVGQQLGQRVGTEVTALTGHLRTDLTKLMSDSLLRQERLVSDLTEAIGSRWDGLLSATYAGLGAEETLAR